MKQANIGLFGCGRWGRNILRDLVSLNVKVLVIDPDSNALKYAIKNGAEDVRSSIDRFSLPLDGYIVASPASKHFENIQELVTFGRPIFVEKPMAISIEDVERITTMPGAMENVFVMHKWRYHSGIKKLRSIIDSGVLGKITGIRLQRTNFGEIHEDVDCAFQLIPHDLSIVLHLLDYIPKVEVVVPNAVGSPNMGLIATLYDKQKNQRISLESNNMVPEKVRSCLVGGELGAAYFSSTEPCEVSLRLFATKHSSSLAISNDMPLKIELKAFLDYVSGGQPPLSSLTDEMKISERIHSIREKLYSGVSYLQADII